MQWNAEKKSYFLTEGAKKAIEEHPEVFGKEKIDMENLEDKEIVGRHFFKQLFSAVRFLHFNKKVVHRDIKWENLLLKYDEEGKELQIKLIDFSIAKEFSD